MKLNLIEILKDAPIRTKLYSPVYGEVVLKDVYVGGRYTYPIEATATDIEGDEFDAEFTADGRLFAKYDGECMLWPSKDCRDWSQFKRKHEPKPESKIKPFDRVLVRDYKGERWVADLFSHINSGDFKYGCIGDDWKYCIPFEGNEDLLGTGNQPKED